MAKFKVIMRRPILTITFFLTVVSLMAQSNGKTIFVGNVISDTTTFRGNLYETGLLSILNSRNNIEIRLITSPSFRFTNYTILTYNKQWSAKYFYYNPDKHSLSSKEIKYKSNIDTVFARLVANNIFSLPDQKNITTKKYYFNPETNGFIDHEMVAIEGVVYRIEFKIGDQFRRYRYVNPDSYADFYPLIYEFRQFANIVGILSDFVTE